MITETIKMGTKFLNKNLHKANQEKKSEFYTQLADIEKELKHYRNQFRNKVVFCNCDDPKESNFVKYFSINFENLGLKKLIATHYKGATLFSSEKPYKLEYSGDKNKNRIPDSEEFLTKMLSDGDFRSQECIELLKKADIVVTNPPFSLFREYVAQLVKYKKKFLILGNVNAITYKEIFKLIKDNKVWLGYCNNRDKKFEVPEYYEFDGIINGKKMKTVGAIWYTNLEVVKRHQPLTLYKNYSPKEYPKYDNYNAIEVSKVLEIPKNYNGHMGVPVTFLDSYNPKQFEILGITDRQNTSGLRTKKYTVNDSPKFNDLNARSVLRVGNNYKAVYARLLIKNRKVKK